MSAPRPKKRRPPKSRRHSAKRPARKPVRRAFPSAGPSLAPAPAQPPPPPPPLRYYRCPKGHEQHDTEEFSLRLGNAFTGEVMHDSGPLCYRCVFDYANPVGSSARQYDEGGPGWYGAVFAFLTESFQTRRIAAPEANRFEVGEAICGLSLQRVVDCPHCQELAKQSAGPGLKVTAVDHDTGIVTFERDDADHSNGS